MFKYCTFCPFLGWPEERVDWWAILAKGQYFNLYPSRWCKRCDSPWRKILQKYSHSPGSLKPFSSSYLALSSIPGAPFHSLSHWLPTWNLFIWYHNLRCQRYDYLVVWSHDCRTLVYLRQKSSVRESGCNGAEKHLIVLSIFCGKMPDCLHGLFCCIKMG